MIREELKNYFENVESSQRPLEVFDIAQNIKNILKFQEEKTTDEQELAELFAFQFVPKIDDHDAGWGIYYGPMLVLRNDRGEMIEYPNIKDVNDAMLAYWRGRARTSKHPVLVSRYADLVAAFEPKLKRTKLDREMVQMVIDSTIDICNMRLSSDIESKVQLKRSLQFAANFNDQKRLEKLKSCIIKADEIAEDDKVGLWGYAFQWLVLDNRKNVLLSAEEISRLIQNLETRLARSLTAEDPDPWRIEHGAKLLAEYYFSIRDEAALESVLKKLEDAFRTNRYANSDGLLVVNYLEKLIGIFHRYAEFNFARQAERRTVTELSNLGEKGRFEMQQFSVTVPIKKEDADFFIELIFGKGYQTRIEEIVFRLAINFVPSKNAVSVQFKDLCRQHVFKYLVGHVVVSPDGYPIAKYGSINEDFDQHLLQHFSEILHFESYFLSLAFEEIRKRFTTKDLFGVLKASPLFRAEDRDYINHMLRSFWKRDYASASSLMIPLIEDAIRGIFKMNRVSYIKANTDAGYDVLPLNNLLHHELLKDVFGDFGENVQYYFQVLLTEGIGWNLRNNFAHGINKQALLSEVVANRLLHVLLCLSLIRNTESN